MSRFVLALACLLPTILTAPGAVSQAPPGGRPGSLAEPRQLGGAVSVRAIEGNFGVGWRAALGVTLRERHLAYWQLWYQRESGAAPDSVLADPDLRFIRGATLGVAPMYGQTFGVGRVQAWAAAGIGYVVHNETKVKQRGFLDFDLGLPPSSAAVPVEAGVMLQLAEWVGVEATANATYSRFEPAWSVGVGVRLGLWGSR